MSRSSLHDRHRQCVLRRFDLIFDAVGPRHYSFDLMSPLLNKGGTFVSIVSPVLQNVDKHGLISGLARSTYTAAQQTFQVTYRSHRERNIDRTRSRQGLSNGVNYRWAAYAADGHALNEIKTLVEQNKVAAEREQRSSEAHAARCHSS